MNRAESAAVTVLVAVYLNLFDASFAVGLRQAQVLVTAASLVLSLLPASRSQEFRSR